MAGMVSNHTVTLPGSVLQALSQSPNAACNILKSIFPTLKYTQWKDPQCSARKITGLSLMGNSAKGVDKGISI